MQTQLTKAFADLNARLHEADQRWANHKLDTLKEGIENAKAAYEAGDDTCAMYYRNGTMRRFDTSLAKLAHYGTRGAKDMLDGRPRADALARMAKNTAALIEKRDATIIKALGKKGITEIPDFELVSVGDGLEGTFKVAQHIVTIRTIVAGGYNIQRLHNRTLVKVRV